MIDRRILLGSALAMAATPVWAKPAPNPDFAADFDELWSLFDATYALFDDRTTDWAKVRRVYRPRAVHAPDLDGFKRVLQQAVTELYDAHTHIYNTPKGTPLYPPYDLFGTPLAGGALMTDGALIHEVLRQSDAEHAGLRAGDVVTHVNGVAMARTVRTLSARCLSRPDPRQDAYALNAALSGVHGKQRRLRVKRGAEVLDIGIVPYDPPRLGTLVSRRLDADIGYIAITSFADDDTLVARFDAALDALKDTKGLILDVRDNGGGDTMMAVPMMGRFIRDRRPYAHMCKRSGRGLGAKWVEYVDPRGPFTYDAPVVVLTDRWSASMAEGFPTGMKGVGRATVVGTPMMGLGAGVYEHTLTRTGVGLQFSAEPVFDIHDRPRSDFVPDIVTRDGEDILAAGLAALKSVI